MESVCLRNTCWHTYCTHKIWSKNDKIQTHKGIIVTSVKVKVLFTLSSWCQISWQTFRFTLTHNTGLDLSRYQFIREIIDTSELTTFEATFRWDTWRRLSTAIHNSIAASILKSWTYTILDCQMAPCAYYGLFGGATCGLSVLEWRTDWIDCERSLFTQEM